MLTSALREVSFVSARGSNEAPLVFIDAAEMSGAIRPSGSYKVENGVLTIRIVLVRDKQLVGEEIVVSGKVKEAEELIGRLVELLVSLSP